MSATNDSNAVPPPVTPDYPQAIEVVIIGGGFAGLEAAKELGKAGIATTIIDRTNHHLFQPLLYQVATAALSATDVAEPIRRVLRHHKSVNVIYGEVAEIDTVSQQLRLTCGTIVRYRYLILASGAGHSYFGHNDWERWAPGLKTIEDARLIRSQILLTFERAEHTSDIAERERLLHIVIVGGGPTGVELAGAIAELSRFTLAKDFRNVNPAATRTTLVEAGPRLLSAFSDKSETYAKSRLERLGVHVRTGESVEDIGPDFIRIGGHKEPVGLVLWAAGVSASPLAQQLGRTDREGRIPVDKTLLINGQANVFAMGDVAVFTDESGASLPGLAQVAKQQGYHLGLSLVRNIKSGTPLAPFRYNSRGNTAIVGRHAAVFEWGRFRMNGWFAWFAWAVIHIYLLVGFPNRFLVSSQWLWRYLTYDRGARLIAGGGSAIGESSFIDIKEVSHETKRHSDAAVRPAGADAMKDPPQGWDLIDQQSYESFPASDPPGNY
ncbi:MAG: NAD(P)/FAD-dependent oxidoreductase [Loktanella sp.]|nr:NAD(P)/FAD-dependent oxidoreductase [Loktanella sp.]